MSNDITVFENTLRPLAPAFNDLLGGIMPAERLIQSAVMCVQKNNKLLDADRQSFLNSIRGSAILGLEMDGVTGQAFPIPFKGIIQLVIGYKGYNTLAARAGLAVTGEVVRQGDPFDFDVGEGWVKHKPQGGDAPMLGAWAKAAAIGRPAIVTWLPIKDILAIKAKSPGARKSESPWNDAAIGFPAMAAKSAKRRLARSTPLTVEAPHYHLAARMEERFEEQGRPAYIAPTAAGIDIVDQPVADGGQPSTEEILNPVKPMSDLLKTARAKALAGPKVVAKWWEKELQQWQRNELNSNLEDLRKLAASPERFFRDEGREAAEGGGHVLTAWWENLPSGWKEKLDHYYNQELKPLTTVDA